MGILSGRKPSAWLFVHSVDHYTVANTKDNSGAAVPAYTLATTGVKANVQPAPSDVKDIYAQDNEIVTHVCYTLDATFFAAVAVGERIVFDGRNYKPVGKKNPIEANRVYRIDLQVEVT